MRRVYTIILLTLLVGCSSDGCSSDPNQINSSGHWQRIESPPGHPELECWSYQRGIAQGAWGGPVCLAPR